MSVGSCLYAYLFALHGAEKINLVFLSCGQDDEDLIVIHDALGYGECHLAVGVSLLFGT
jgi:hypothetical protein